MCPPPCLSSAECPPVHQLPGNRPGQAAPGLAGLATQVITASILLLTAPLFIFGGCLLVFFYHVETFSIASQWFFYLPKCLFGNGFISLLCTFNIILYHMFPTGGLRRALFLLLLVLLSSSCLLGGLTTFGCFELKSTILQETFLTLRTGAIMEQYQTEPDFREDWDRLQRQFFCCGTALFNTGFEDWKQVYGRENNSVPDSCCHREAPSCGAGALEAASPGLVIYTHGCLAILQNKLETELVSLITVFQVSSLLVLLCCLVSLVVSLCQPSVPPGPTEDDIPASPGAAGEAKPDLFTTMTSSEV